MKVPGYLKLQRGQSLDDPEVVPTPFSALDILTEHNRIHFIRYQGQLVEYVPLSIAEEIELEQLTEEPMMPLHYMLAKAISLRVASGMYSASEFVSIEDGQSLYESVKHAITEEMNSPTQMELMTQISKKRNMTIQSVLDCFESNGEKDAYPTKDSKPFPRTANPLDPHIGIVMSLTEKSSFTLDELSSLTRLQYTYLSLCQQQALIRQSNDHQHMRTHK